MIIGLIVILIVLWFFGYINIQGLSLPDVTLFAINNRAITLWDLLILLVISAVVGVLPSPFRQIAAVLLILWILSVLGILGIAALPSLLVLAIIIGLIIFVLGGF